MFARKLSRLAGLVLVLTVAFGAGALGADGSVALSDTQTTAASAGNYDWN